MSCAGRSNGRRGLPPIGVRVTPHTLSIYALVIQRRDRRQFGDAFDRYMRDAIPSMQHATMQSTRPVPKAV